MLRQQYGLWTDNGASEIVSKAEDTISTTEPPYLLFLDFLEAHQPYRPPRGYIREFLPDDVSVDEMNAVIDANHIGKTITGRPFDDRERRILEGLYDGAIGYLDSQIRRLYNYLEEIGQAEDTVFIVLADHGDCFGEWGLWGHQGRIHNRLSHVPLIINYPWTSGQREGGIVELRQLCNHLGTLGEGVESTTNAVLQPRGEAVTEYYGLDTQVSITPWEEYEEATSEQWGSYQVSLVRDQWRLFHQTNGTSELYDVIADPGERKNIISDHKNVAGDLRNRIEEIVGLPERNHQKYRLDRRADDFELNEKTEDHLKDLGYM